MVAIGWTADAVYAARQALVKELKDARTHLSSTISATSAARSLYQQLKTELEGHRKACRSPAPNTSTFAVHAWRVKREETAQALRNWTTAEEAEVAARQNVEMKALEAYKAILLMEKMEDVIDVVAEAETERRRERMRNSRRKSL